MNVIIANNAKVLAALGPDISVGAEFGDECVTGALITLAHQGPRAGNPAPCVADIRFRVTGKDLGAGLTCVVSRIDLGTLGGIAAVLGRKLKWDDFWAAAAAVDAQGLHLESILEGVPDAPDIESAFHAFWAWSEQNRVSAPRDGSASDITVEVAEALRVLDLILYPPAAIIAVDGARERAELFQGGVEWRRAKKGREEEYFVAGQTPLQSS